ncbi:hypothetical protein SAMN05421671_0053 [Pimelobacter simplex]|nr:hypothetical protein SAMN05421671_0053 [Pimelobacter simplex]
MRVGILPLQFGKRCAIWRLHGQMQVRLDLLKHDLRDLRSGRIYFGGVSAFETMFTE